MSQPINPLRRYIRDGKLPHFFCPGCGCGQILNGFIRAVDELGLDMDHMVCVSGVGCTARIPVYLKTDMLHGVHGRTLAWATGIKLHKPDARVVVFAGDGDAASIGGNHLIHAARRNLDVLMIVANNFNFAMTGGQVAPLTPEQSVTMTTPYGSPEPVLDLCALAAAAGATYVARETTLQPVRLKRTLARGLEHKGFALIEVLSPCPTNYGRYALGNGRPEVSLEWIKAHSVSKAGAEKVGPDEREGKYIIGEFVNVTRPVFAGTSTVGKEDCP